ncbi:MAG: hypothetical protein ABSF92_02525 [Candidatus Acidiferrales bacterium]|jgi:hypothetical protein
MLLAKVALGLGGTFVLAGAYSFHEGVIRVSVDEHRATGEHLHLVVPAALVPVAMRLAPQHAMEDAARQAGPWLPTVRRIAKELRKLPDAELVEVRDAEQFTRVRTQDGKLLLDVEGPGETVHIACPLVTVEHLSDEILSRRAPESRQ